MSVNVFWILLSVILTYIFSKDVSLSAISGIIVLIILSYIRILSNLVSYLKSKTYVILRKKLIEKIIISFLMLILTILIFYHFFPIAESNLAIHRLEKSYAEMPTKLIVDARNKLKNHSNDIRYCALFMFPSLENNNPENIARYLAYYSLEDKYCNEFWQFGNNDCVYLKRLDYNGHPITLLKNIRLCEIAKSREFKFRLFGAG